jgi:hypothetical protein
VTYDGITHAVEWTSPNLGDSFVELTPLLLSANLDGDLVDEIIVGLPTGRIQVFDGASPTIQWVSSVLAGSLVDLALGDLDGNGTPDLAILTGQFVYVFDTNGWGLLLQRAQSNGSQVEIAYADLTGPGELMVVTSEGPGPYSRLHIWPGISAAGEVVKVLATW